jgi:hypothetical protein
MQEFELCSDAALCTVKIYDSEGLPQEIIMVGRVSRDSDGWASHSILDLNKPWLSLAQIVNCSHLSGRDYWL